MGGSFHGKLAVSHNQMVTIEKGHRFAHRAGLLVGAPEGDDARAFFVWVLLGLRGNIPSGKHTKNDGTSPFFMGKSTISMTIFNSYVSLPEGTAFARLTLR